MPVPARSGAQWGLHGRLERRIARELGAEEEEMVQVVREFAKSRGLPYDAHGASLG